MGEEKRQYVRWREKIQVAYVVEGEKQPYREVFTEDVSEVGVLIDAFEELESGQNVQLKIEFVYDSVPIMARAKVMHVKKSEDRYKIGLEFLGLDDFQKQRFARYLEMIKKEHSQKAE
ncbi:MAG: PilZ domain-containing protein [Candidatus Omnitrophota bacterium]